MQQALYCPQCKKVLEELSNEYYCQDCAYTYPVINNIPSFVAIDMATDSFDATAFEFLFEMEQKHFWHIGRRELILDVLRRNISDLTGSRMLEVGCGNGNILAYLKQNGINIEGGDLFLEGLEFCQRRTGSAGLYQIDVLNLPFRNNFDIIGIFDVLEHIDNDVKALGEINQALKPGGKLLLTVPSHKYMWSYFDVQSHHKRRYNKKELVTKLEQTGFTIKKISYYMFFLFPVFAAVRFANHIFRKTIANNDVKTSIEVKTIPVINWVFSESLRLEKLLIRHINLRFGASLIALAEKPNGK